MLKGVRLLNRRNHENDRDININDDYLELLNRTDEYEDIYSGASDDYEDISSSSGDIYIGGGRRNTVSDNDIYFSNGRRNASSQVQNQESMRNQYTQVYNTPNYAPPASALPPVAKKSDKFDTQNLGDDISDHEARRKKKGRGKKTVFLIVVALILAVVMGIGGYVTSVVNGIVGQFNEAEEIEHIDDVDSLLKEDHVRNILLIGTDAEKGGSARSDSIMIASVNKETGRITVCSILRDTHVDIPSECEAKINSAYAWGGANLLIQTIEENFGIYIDDYAEVDFEMFTALVDALGGIEVDVTEAEANYINNQHRYGSEEKPDEVPSGEGVHLDGYQALWYVRIRKLDSDWYRTERQRKVIGSVIEKIKGKVEEGDINALTDIANDVAPYITTTLSTSDFWDLMFSMVSCFIKSDGEMDNLFISQQIPFEDTWSYTSEWDGSSISLDLDENRDLLEELLYEDYDIEAKKTEDE